MQDATALSKKPDANLREVRGLASVFRASGSDTLQVFSDRSAAPGELRESGRWAAEPAERRRLRWRREVSPGLQSQQDNCLPRHHPSRRQTSLHEWASWAAGPAATHPDAIPTSAHGCSRNRVGRCQWVDKPWDRGTRQSCLPTNTACRCSECFQWDRPWD